MFHLTSFCSNSGSDGGPHERNNRAQCRWVSRLTRCGCEERSETSWLSLPSRLCGPEPRAIPAGLVDVLVYALYLDFAFVRLCDPTGGAAVEIARGRPLATPRDSAPAGHLLMSRVRTDTPRCTNPAI